MDRARNTESKRSITPRTSIFQSASAQVMVPRLMVGLSALALLALGLVMVYSASSITAYIEEGDSIGETLKQCFFAVVGLALGFAAIFFGKAEFWRGRGDTVFWGICVAGLLLTALLGTVGLGAKRWLIIGPVSIQVSEFAKIAFVMVAARILDDYNEGALDFRQLALQLVGFVIAPLGFLLITQTDLGTTVIIFAALLVVFWLSGRSTKLVIAVIAAAAVIVAIAIVVQPYRFERLLTFSDPWSDAEDTGYQLIRSFKALSAGGLFGVGIGNSYEKLQYLPEAETDFIFAIVGEELGLIGALVVVVLFMVLLVGGLRVASQAGTPYGSMVAAGLTFMIVFQAFLNILCVIGCFPTTGKPLPFMSSGGSSLVSSLFLVGIVLGISFDSHNDDEVRRRRDNLRVVSAYRADGATRQGSVVRAQTSHRALQAEAAAPRDAGRVPLRVSRAASAYDRGQTVRATAASSARASRRYRT